MAGVNDDANPPDTLQPGAPDPETPKPVSTEPVAPEPVIPDPIPAPGAPGPGGAPGEAGIRLQNRLALLGTLGLVAVLIVGGAILIVQGPSRDGPQLADIGASPTAGGSPGASLVVPTPLVMPTPLADDPLAGLPSDGNRLGRPDAKVVVEYWADYQCPFCAKFAQERIPDLVPLIEDGTVALVHRDFAFIGPESFDAAIAVRCAGREGRYWAMHDAVYAAQDGENKGAFSRDRLAAIAASIGLDGATLQACFDDRSLFVDVLDDTAAATRTAIKSTPTIDINGTRYLGVPEPGQMQTTIAEAVAGASPEPLPTEVPIPDPWADAGAMGRVAGSASAPVTVDLWLDYQSPDSATISGELAAGLQARVTDGSTRVVLHDLALLGDESVVAATFVRCVDAQGGPAWLVSDILSGPAQGPDAGIFVPDNLLRLGAQLGLDIRALDGCLGDGTVAQAVRDETAAGEALGLTAGPAIIVSAGGAEVARFSGTLDATAVLAAIDKAR
jgi:protein-disulfide isomerase